MDRHEAVARLEVIASNASEMLNEATNGKQARFHAETVEAIDIIKEALKTRQGVWIQKQREVFGGTITYTACSECGERTPKNQFGQDYLSNYCPGCGAEMTDKCCSNCRHIAEESSVCDECISAPGEYFMWEREQEEK